MQPWQLILLALGGNAALLLALGWLARSLGSQFLAKDIEKFKAELTAVSAASIEGLEHEFQLAALEHQVRFSKLHERRAEVITELYRLLVETEWAAKGFVSSLDAPQPEKYVTAMNKAAEFYWYFEKNRIYLPHPLCEQLEQFIRNMRNQVSGFGAYVSKDEAFLPDHVLEEKHHVWMKAAEYFNKEVPNARSALEAALRSILGPTTPSRRPGLLS